MAFTTSGQETEWALFLQPRSPHGAWLMSLTVTLSKDDLGSYVLRRAKHLQVFELSAVFVNGAFVQVCRHCNDVRFTSTRRNMCR